jgi:hypothetical protein
MAYRLSPGARGKAIKERQWPILRWFRGPCIDHIREYMLLRFYSFIRKISKTYKTQIIERYEIN